MKNFPVTVPQIATDIDCLGPLSGRAGRGRLEALASDLWLGAPCQFSPASWENVIFYRCREGERARKHPALCQRRRQGLYFNFK